MKRLALLLLVLLALPATAAAKGGHSDIKLQWLSIPDGTRAGETWTASFEFRDPNGNRLIMDNVHPVVRAVSDSDEVVVNAVYGDTVGRYVAEVRFPSAGSYHVSLEQFDPRDPYRFIDMGPPVAIGAAVAPPLAGSTGFPWPILIVLGLAVPALLFIGRTRRPPAVSRARNAPGAPPEAG
jgi:hypothetical protein